MRRMLAGEDKALVRDVWRGISRCAGTSLLAGAVTGISMAAAQAGLAGLHAISGTPAVLRGFFSALLMLQLFWAVPLGLGMLSQPDTLQRRPMRCLFAAGRQIAACPLRYAGLCAVTLLPLALLFAWRTPLPTFLGFLLVELLLLAPAIMLWQNRGSGIRNQGSGRRNFGVIAVLSSFFVFDIVALLMPALWRREFPARAAMATLRQTVDFIARQTLLEARNGTLREMLASSGTWPLLFVTLLGCACCMMAAFACACYGFRLRRLAFAGAAALQVLPILSGYAGLELLLRGLYRGRPLLLGIAWIALYLFLLLMLYRNFRRQLPDLRKRQETQSGVRLFFYYAVPRARYWIYALAAVSALGCWNDALAPFRYMRELGAFSLAGYVWEHTDLWGRVLYPALFLAMLALVLTFLRRCARINRT